MDWKDEFQDAVERYKRLELLWTTATVLLVTAYFSVPVSFGLGVLLFVLGSLNLGAAGVSCAYVIARDNT